MWPAIVARASCRWIRRLRSGLLCWSIAPKTSPSPRLMPSTQSSLTGVLIRRSHVRYRISPLGISHYYADIYGIARIFLWPCLHFRIQKQNRCDWTGSHWGCTHDAFRVAWPDTMIAQGEILVCDKKQHACGWAKFRPVNYSCLHRGLFYRVSRRRRRWKV